MPLARRAASGQPEPEANRAVAANLQKGKYGVPSGCRDPSVAGSQAERDRIGLGDSEARQTFEQSLLRNRNESRHSTREADGGEEVHAAVEARGERGRVEIDDERDPRALLPEQEEERLVVLTVMLRRVDEGERAKGGRN